MGVRYALPPPVLLFSRILYCTAFYKITKIVRPLWLAESVFAWGYVNMVVASKCFAFRALITQAQIWKRFDTFTLFTHSLVGWNLEDLWKHAVSIWFRLSWQFKRKNSYFWKASLFQKKNWLRGKLRVQDFATGKNFSFNHCPKQRVFLFSHESYFTKSIENFFPVFA